MRERFEAGFAGDISYFLDDDSIPFPTHRKEDHEDGDADEDMMDSDDYIDERDAIEIDVEATAIYSTAISAAVGESTGEERPVHVSASSQQHAPPTSHAVDADALRKYTAARKCADWGSTLCRVKLEQKGEGPRFIGSCEWCFKRLECGGTLCVRRLGDSSLFNGAGFWDGIKALKPGWRNCSRGDLIEKFFKARGRESLMRCIRVPSVRDEFNLVEYLEVTTPKMKNKKTKERRIDTEYKDRIIAASIARAM
jgi:hypothetical protein